jgi:predicted dehydrogenase
MPVPPVRLALVGDPDDVGIKAMAMERVRGGQVAFTARSMPQALQNNSPFDAAVVHSAVDAIAGAESGKHILVDAPVANSVEEAELLIAAAEKTGVILGVAHLLRYAPANQTIMDRLSNGKLGEPGLLRVHRWNSRPEQPLAAKLYGDVDFAIHLFAALPTEIYSLGRGNGKYVQIHLGFPMGGMAILDFSAGLPNGQSYDSLSLIGSAGAAYSDDHHNSHLMLAGEHPTALISGSGNGMSCELQTFIDRISAGNADPTVANSILAVHRVINTVHQSMTSKQVLQVSANLP